MREDVGRRGRRAAMVIGYLVVLAVLVLTPAPSTLLTTVAVVWIALGLIAWVRAMPSSRRSVVHRGRRSRAEQRAARLTPQQGRTPGRRGDNPHR